MKLWGMSPAMAFSSSLRGKIVLAMQSRDQGWQGVRNARLAPGFRRDRSQEVYLRSVH